MFFPYEQVTLLFTPLYTFPYHPFPFYPYPVVLIPIFYSFLVFPVTPSHRLLTQCLLQSIPMVLENVTVYEPSLRYLEYQTTNMLHPISFIPADTPIILVQQGGRHPHTQIIVLWCVYHFSACIPNSKKNHKLVSQINSLIPYPIQRGFCGITCPPVIAMFPMSRTDRHDRVSLSNPSPFSPTHPIPISIPFPSLISVNSIYIYPT